MKSTIVGDKQTDKRRANRGGGGVYDITFWS